MKRSQEALKKEKTKLDDKLKAKKENFQYELKEMSETFKSEHERLKTEIDEFKQEKDKIAKAQFNLSDILTLNVSGVKKGFTVPRSLLTSVKGSGLEAFFSGRHELEMVDQNPYLNRDPDTFKLLLQYLRNDLEDLKI